MSAYTDAELIAVAREVWPKVSHDYAHFRQATLHGLSCAWLSYGTDSVREFAVRLALAHPAKAGEALGPGWSVYPVGQEDGWSGPRHFIDTGGSHKIWMPWVESEHYPEHVIWHLHTGLIVLPGVVFNRSDACEEGWEELPPEFDAALQRARLIAAAWQRIEAAK